jgi:hypothetical protein
VWDLAWERFEAFGGRIRKLSVIDTGTGMTAEQMRDYINQLAASWPRAVAHGQLRRRSPRWPRDHDAPTGSSTAPGTRAKARSRFRRHRDARWGLEPQTWSEGRIDFWRPLVENDKPWLLRGLAHRTQVVLLGEDERHDTPQAPNSVTGTRLQWITRRLHARTDRPDRRPSRPLASHGQDACWHVLDPTRASDADCRSPTRAGAAQVTIKTMPEPEVFVG